MFVITIWKDVNVVFGPKASNLKTKKTVRGSDVFGEWHGFQSFNLSHSGPLSMISMKSEFWGGLMSSNGVTALWTLFGGRTLRIMRVLRATKVGGQISSRQVDQKQNFSRNSCWHAFNAASQYGPWVSLPCRPTSKSLTPKLRSCQSRSLDCFSWRKTYSPMIPNRQYHSVWSRTEFVEEWHSTISSSGTATATATATTTTTTTTTSTTTSTTTAAAATTSSSSSSTTTTTTDMISLDEV